MSSEVRMVTGVLGVGRKLLTFLRPWELGSSSA